MRYLGIDPGKSGALALLDESMSVLSFVRTRDLHDAVGYARAIHGVVARHGAITLAALELTSTRPGQGVSSMHEYGRTAGWWEGILCAFAIPHVLVTPQRWQKAVFDSRGRKDTKTHSLETARRMFPQFAEQLGAKDDGLADALHLARYAGVVQQPQSAGRLEQEATVSTHRTH